MPLDLTTATGWRRPTVGEIVEELRADIDAALVAAGFDPQEYDDTLLGAIVEALSVFSARRDSQSQAAYLAGFPMYAVGRQLDDLGGLARPRRPGTRTRATFTASARTGLTAVVQAGRAVELNGARWVAAETTTVTDSGDPVVYEAADIGPVQPGAAGTAELVDFVASLDDVVWSGLSADIIQSGRDAETDAAYRTRLLRPLGGAADTGPGLRDRMLARLTWLSAAGVLAGPDDGLASGEWEVTLTPAPATTDQTQALADLLARAISGADFYSGAVTGTGTYPDGTPRTVRWTVGTEQAVNIVVTVVLASGVVLSSVSDEVEDAVRAYFAGLGTGGVARILGLLAAVAAVDGVTGATVTLNGGGSDVAPSTAADLLVPGTLTVTT